MSGGTIAAAPVASAVLGAGVLGAGASIYGSSQAASAQESAANQASNTQAGMFNITQQNLQPYIQTGQNALTRENALAGNFNYQPTQAQTAQTPGYQFTLNQGLKSTENAAAARGLGGSGAALKAAAGYATGLANNTYQNQYNNALTSYQANLGGLQNVANLGENAAAGVGDAATKTGGQIGSSIIGGSNAAAAAYNNIGNAIGNAGNAAVNGILTNNLNNNSNNNLINGMYGNGNDPAVEIPENGFLGYGR